VVEITIPGRGRYSIEHVIVDLNGTVAQDGKMLKGVKERIRELSRMLDVIVVTADTNRNAEVLLHDFPVTLNRIKEVKEKEQKLELVVQKGAHTTVSIGNGCNDAAMLKGSAIGICIVGGEGASTEAIMASDVVVFNVNDALDLLLRPQRLKATLRS